MPVVSKSEKRSVQCLKLIYTGPLFFQKSSGNSIGRIAVTSIIIRSTAHILTRWKECILNTDFICIKSSHILGSVHTDKANVKIATSLGLVFNSSVLLSVLIALSNGDTEILAQMRQLKVRRKIFILRVSPKSEPSLETQDPHPFLRRKWVRGSR